MNEQKLLEFCKQNVDAVRLILELHKFFCTWDDCIDRDKPASDREINGAFIWAMFGLNENGFFASNRDVLKAALLNCVALWMAANNFEKTKNSRLLHQSFVMRCAPYNLFGLIVLLTGGMGNQAAALEYFYSLNESDALSEYLTEHKGG